MEKKGVLKYLVILAILSLLMFSFLISLLIYVKESGLTGFAVFESGSQDDFNDGIYQNITYNGSAAVLSESNISGIYTSKIFYSGADAAWNNLTWQGNEPAACTGTVDLCNSCSDQPTCENQQGCWWNLPSCVNSGNCSSCKNKSKCNKCGDAGCEWEKEQENCLGAVDCSIYEIENDCEKCELCSWSLASCSGAAASCASFSNQLTCENQQRCWWQTTALSVQVRNCSQNDCSDSEFIDKNLSNLNLQSKYFQYRVSFLSSMAGISPAIQSVSIGYSSLCTENWTAEFTTCNISDQKLKYYTDKNSCNTINNLPEDNGTIEPCDYCIPEWYEINTTCNQNDKITRWYNDSNNCYAITNLESDNNLPVNNSYACDYIVSSKFTGTNLSIVNLSNIANLVLEVSNYGKINFSGIISINQSLDFDSNINLFNNSIFINSTALPQFNKSAVLTLYNLVFINPIILKDGSECPASICTKISYENRTVVFNVTQFSTYSTAETPAEEAPVGGGSSGKESSSSDDGGGHRRNIPVREESTEEKNEEILTEIPAKEEKPTEARAERALFDLASDLTKSELFFGEKPTAKISLINLGVPGRINVSLYYSISDSENRAILTEQETMEIETRTEFIKFFELPSNSGPGKYKLSVKLTYLGQKEEALSENSFQVIKKPARLTGLSAEFIIGAMIILIIALTIILVRKNACREKTAKTKRLKKRGALTLAKRKYKLFNFLIR
ncbi:MAG: hypothetical protein AABW48_05395 [Nanoarchaeota archaeon]